MKTIRKYNRAIDSEMDASLLRASGIEPFLPDQSSAAIGYGTVVEPVRLQVQDADADQAIAILEQESKITPLPDDFESQPLPPEPPETEPNKVLFVPIAVAIGALLALIFLTRCVHLR